MSISGRFTGIGIDGTRLFAEHVESLRPGFGGPSLRLEESSFAVRPEPELRGKSGEEEVLEVEEEFEPCLCGCLAFRAPPLIVTDLTAFDMVVQFAVGNDEKLESLSAKRGV